MRALRRTFWVLISLAILGGFGYLGYSAWYSYNRWQGTPTNALVCVDGVPVASAAGIENTVRQFVWSWGPLPQLPSEYPQIPIAKINFRSLPSRPSRDTVMIRFTPESNYNQQRDYVRSIGGNIERSLSRIDALVVNFGSSRAPETFAPSPIVLDVESDWYTGVSAGNDEFFGLQWGLANVGAEAIWATLPADAPRIRIAVIDSGVCLLHPDLAGRIIGGWDFVENDNDPEDQMGHGCGVAGVIAANIDNSVGVAGVAPIAEIMALRVLDKKGIGTQSNIAAAIMYAADRDVDIINMSLAGPNASATIQDAVNYALGKGVTLIASAGNAGVEGAWYPAAFDNVIAVGAIDPTGERSSFSNFGVNVDIYAPGRDIYTTGLSDSYITMTGTSFAAPIVSGLTALDFAINGVPQEDTYGTVVQPPVVTETCTS